jgi:hypothetical protein
MFSHKQVIDDESIYPSTICPFKIEKLSTMKNSLLPNNVDFIWNNLIYNESTYALAQFALSKVKKLDNYEE